VLVSGKRSDSRDKTIAVIFAPQFVVHRHNVQCFHFLHRQENGVFPVAGFVVFDLELKHLKRDSFDSFNIKVLEAFGGKSRRLVDWLGDPPGDCC